jgi:hypothetical protein
MTTAAALAEIRDDIAKAMQQLQAADAEILSATDVTDKLMMCLALAEHFTENAINYARMVRAKRIGP